MTEFRWMAPILVGFTTRPGAAVRAPEECAQMWGRIAARAGSTTGSEGWDFPRQGGSEPVLGWSLAAGEVMPRPLEAILGHADPARLPASDLLFPTEATWALYDHGVLLMEGLLQTQPDATPTPQDAQMWESEVQRLGTAIAQEIAAGVMEQLVDLLDEDEEADDYLVAAAGEIGLPVWVTRALVVDPDVPGHDDFARAWVGGIDADHRVQCERLLAGDQPLVAQWMNHLHRRDRGEDVEESWSALRRAQFFWTALQGIDERLRLILARAMGPDDEISLAELQSELQETVDAAQEVLMLKAEVLQHASRRSIREMLRFLDFWDYQLVLEDPVREKVENCKGRLTTLAEERSARSAMFTDILLMCIGVTSILATAIALVQFGRSAVVDPDQSKFDFGAGAITSWISSQPMDVVLVLSLLTSIVLVVVFVWKRRQTLS